MDKNRLNHLYHQYLADALTPEEQQEWEIALLNPDLDESLQEFVHQSWDDKALLNYEISSTNALEILNAILIRRQRQQSKAKMRWLVPAAAAILLLSLSSSLFFYFHVSKATKNYYVNDLGPGTAKAVLTLDNGVKINLDDAANGKLASESGINITKTKNGQLVYEVKDPDRGTKPGPGKSPAYNTITTPRGGQYQVNLPDGSSIWLNAASSLKFPATFAGLEERRVELSGEAYFEIAKVFKNKDLGLKTRETERVPFIVVTGKQQVEVLGTHFNINGYHDEPVIKTTLLEGSVRLNGNTLLKPGEQAVNSGSSIEVNAADTELAIAWKNGKFKFVNENIRDLMRKLARWYDADVVYEGQMTNKDFSGSVSRFDHISKILDVLESTNTVHFKVEGRRITVMP